MAKKMNGSSTPAPRSTAAPAVSTTPVRNSSIPPRPTSPIGATKRPQPTYDQIAKRAYEIWKSGSGGSQDDNWFRAERELRGY